MTGEPMGLLAGSPGMMAGALLAVALAQAAAAFAESSITSLSVARLKSLKAVAGGPFWRAAQRWLDHPEEYLTLLLFIQNLMEASFAWLLMIVASWFIASSLERDLAVWMIGGAFSLILLTIYPKILARRLTHGIFGVWILRALHALLTPFYPFLHAFFWVIAKVSGGSRSGAALGKGVYLSFEELRELINEVKAGAEVDVAAHVSPLERRGMEMAANYLRLKDVRVGDVMTSFAAASAVRWDDLTGAPKNSPQRERLVFSLMTDGHSRTIVLKGGMPSGYIHAKDMLRHLVFIREKNIIIKILFLKERGKNNFLIFQI